MRIAAVMLLSGLAVAALSQTASAAVEVSFVHPERYTDAAFGHGYGDKAREPVLRHVREHLELLGARHLKPNQTLQDRRPGYRPRRPVRVVAAICLQRANHARHHWPPDRCALHLAGGDRTLLVAEELISDLNYQTRMDVTLVERSAAIRESDARRLVSHPLRQADATCRLIRPAPSIATGNGRDMIVPPRIFHPRDRARLRGDHVAPPAGKDKAGVQRRDAADVGNIRRCITAPSVSKTTARPPCGLATHRRDPSALAAMLPQ